MIHIKFKIDKYIILINSMMFEINKLLLKHLKNNTAEDEYEIFVKKGTKILIKKMNLICSWDNIENIKFELKKIKYIIEKNIDLISIDELEKIFEYNITNGKEVFNVIKFMTEQSEMNIILKEITLYKEKIEKVWYKNLSFLNYYTEIILNYDSDIMGTVYIVSDRYYVGQADLETKNARIIYGSKFTNGDTVKDIVYIYHEILHNPILPYKKFNIDKKIVHGIIKIIADNYLYIVLKPVPKSAVSLKEGKEIVLYSYFLRFVHRRNKKYISAIALNKQLKLLVELNSDIDNSVFAIYSENELGNNVVDFVKIIGKL